METHFFKFSLFCELVLLLLIFGNEVHCVMHYLFSFFGSLVYCIDKSRKKEMIIIKQSRELWNYIYLCHKPTPNELLHTINQVAFSIKLQLSKNIQNNIDNLQYWPLNSMLSTAVCMLTLSDYLEVLTETWLISSLDHFYE